MVNPHLQPCETRWAETFAWLVLCFLLFPVVSNAQLVLPVLRDSGNVVYTDGSPARVQRTATHGQYAIAQKEYRLGQNYSIVDVPPTDSLKALVKAFAKTQVAAFADAKGIDLQPHAIAALWAGQDKLSQQQFNTWLATESLSWSDRASAYVALFRENLDPSRPDRLAVAEEALTQIKALLTQPQWIGMYFKFHLAMAEIYYTAGRSQDVVRHTDIALTIGESMLGWGRIQMMSSEFPVLSAVMAMSAFSDADVRINAFLARWRKTVSADATDSAIMNRQGMQDYLKYNVPALGRSADATIQQVRMIGATASPIELHAMLTAESVAPVPVTQPIALDDGKIRVLEWGANNCAPCKDALGPLGRLRSEFRTQPVEILYLTETTGSWGADLVETAEELPKIREMYVERLKSELPIGVWCGDALAPTKEGQVYRTPDPNRERWLIRGTPTIYVVDGKGRIRYVRVGWGRVDETQRIAELRTVVQFLLQESSADSGNKTAPIWRDVKDESKSASVVSSGGQ